MAFTDTFTGTANQALEDRAGWTLVDGVAGAAQINASSQLKCTSSQLVGSYLCTDQGSADHYTQAKVYATSGSFPVAVRVTDGNNFFALRYHTTEWQLYRRTAGSLTLLGSYTATLTPGDVAYLEANGDQLTCKINGITRIGPVTNTGHATATRQGTIPRATTSDPFIDDFEAGTLAGSHSVTIGNASSQPTASGVSVQQAILVGAASVTSQPSASGVGITDTVAHWVRLTDAATLARADSFAALARSDSFATLTSY